MHYAATPWQVLWALCAGAGGTRRLSEKCLEPLDHEPVQHGMSYSLGIETLPQFHMQLSWTVHFYQCFSVKHQLLSPLAIYFL